VIENKPGATTNLGADFVAKAAPDGYTVLLGDVATYAAKQSLYKKLQFDPRADAWLRGDARVFDVDAMFRKAADGPDAGFRCHGSIVLCLLEMRNNSPGLMRARKFPYAAIVMIAHGVASAVPIIEGANHANTVGVWRPHRKCNAFRPSLSSSGGC
jgi:hypothetical protein